jgi:hypothetical protein
VNKDSQDRGCYYAPAQWLVLCAYAQSRSERRPFATRQQPDRDCFGYGAMRTRTDFTNQWNADLLWISMSFVIEPSWP